MKITSLTSDNFKETISTATKPVIIDFYADWCVPCKMVTPILEDIAENSSDDCTVYKVNIDDNPELASEFSVMTIPNIIAFKDGNAHKRVIGVQTKEAILDLLN